MLTLDLIKINIELNECILNLNIQSKTNLTIN